jgi:hypothetical protein
LSCVYISYLSFPLLFWFFNDFSIEGGVLYDYSCCYFSYLLINYFSSLLLELLLLIRFAVSVLSNEALTLSTISGAGPGKQATKGCFKSSFIPERFKGEIKRHL